MRYYRTAVFLFVVVLTSGHWTQAAAPRSGAGPGPRRRLASAEAVASAQERIVRRSQTIIVNDDGSTVFHEGDWRTVADGAPGAGGPQQQQQQQQQQQGAAGGGGSYQAFPGKNIPKNDVACGQKEWDGRPAPWCKVCGGRLAVESACNGNPTCVAYDMESADCGYLKRSGGPLAANQRGFTSYVRRGAGAGGGGGSSRAGGGGGGGGGAGGGSGGGTYIQVADTNIIGNDITCGLGTRGCKVCGGRGRVESACSSSGACLAYVMESQDCGYLKSARGPLGAKGGSSTFVRS